jgi:LDH2 family malate/lactate/ureidoglycolate dehydrogenase
MNARYAYRTVFDFSLELLERAGMDRTIGRVVTETLLEGDLTGHTTHGLQLLSPYLAQIESGDMRTSGEPHVIKDNGGEIFWDGRYLPGPWLIHNALDTACERIDTYSVITMLIKRSHHTAALISYLKRVTDKNLVVMIFCSDPSAKSIAPFGGTEPVYSPNPIAVGIPSNSGPVLIDISTSATAHGVVSRYYQADKSLPGKWLIDNNGKLTDDPAAAFSEPPGSILPLGGADLGYKGFALGLMVEALTSALAGTGRADHIADWGASVLIQVFNPAGFGGVEKFLRETGYLTGTCRNNKPADPNRPVRLPGERALRMREDQLKNGLILEKTVIPSLKEWAEKFDLSVPQPQQ